MNTVTLIDESAEAKKKAQELIDRSRAVIDDCARLRAQPPQPMTIAEAVELDEYLRRTPDAVVTPARLREAVAVLAYAVKGL